MPIDPSVLQRRHWQDGRIRLGVKKISKNGKEYPSKIETFRFTSPSEEMIRGVAELYGGQVKPWKSPQGPQFEVITDAKRIPVIVPPNGLSQNMELWDGKLCVRRCTGVVMQPPFVGPCLCGADVEIKRRPCKPHTRLGVFLKRLRSLGLWRLDSKGGNAAAELPNAAEFLAHAGTYVDAWLYVAERTGSFLDPKDNVVKAGRFSEWMGQRLYENGFRYRSVSSHPALIAYRSASPRWRMIQGQKKLGTRSKHAWMHAQTLDPRRLGVVSFEYVAPRP